MQRGEITAKLVYAETMTHMHSLPVHTHTFLILFNLFVYTLNSSVGIQAVISEVEKR